MKLILLATSLLFASTSYCQKSKTKKQDDTPILMDSSTFWLVKDFRPFGTPDTSITKGVIRYAINDSTLRKDSAFIFIEYRMGDGPYPPPGPDGRITLELRSHQDKRLLYAKLFNGDIIGPDRILGQ